MIEIRYSPSVRRLRVYGHANAGEYGHDLVCAGVSALVLTLGQALSEITNDADIDIREGEADIVCTRKDYVIDFLFATIAGGLRCLAENYPQNIDFLESVG